MWFPILVSYNKYFIPKFAAEKAFLLLFANKT